VSASSVLIFRSRAVLLLRTNPPFFSAGVCGGGVFLTDFRSGSGPPILAFLSAIASLSVPSIHYVTTDLPLFFFASWASLSIPRQSGLYSDFDTRIIRSERKVLSIPPDW